MIIIIKCEREKERANKMPCNKIGLQQTHMQTKARDYNDSAKISWKSHCIGIV